MNLSRNAVTLAVVAQMACAASPQVTIPLATTTHPRVGVLVMAHGGGAEWNREVAQAVEPLRKRVPTALAFGMADRNTLAAGLDSLRMRGVDRVAVVRVFVSGASFLPRTAHLLGLDIPHLEAQPGSPPIEHGLRIATHLDGLSEWDGTASIVTERALAVSEDPRTESVLLLAHGQGDEGLNDRLLVRMERAAAAVRNAGFRRVRTVTLREDWPAARRVAEESARQFVDQRSRRGERVIVVPFRLAGFGPYAEVLAGLPYAATPGFLPHPTITDWIAQTAVKIVCQNAWQTADAQCRWTVTHRDHLTRP